MTATPYATTTATPTDAIYTYSLRQGIEDGFLAPYRVHSDEAGRGFRFEGGRHSDLKPARRGGVSASPPSTREGALLALHQCLQLMPGATLYRV
jgi:hypothetical protein